MTTISFTRLGGGKHGFTTERDEYVLRYIPDPSVRGAYSYELVRIVEDSVDKIADFATLQDARKWVTAVGFNFLDSVGRPSE